MKRLIILAGLAAALSGPAIADICAYKPSRLIGAGTTGVISTGSASLAAVGLSMKAAGFYTLTHAASGAAMLASTAGGASAAGTVGIMGGTAGTIGTVSAGLMSPMVIVPAAMVAGSAALFEGGCYLAKR